MLADPFASIRTHGIWIANFFLWRRSDYALFEYNCVLVDASLHKLYRLDSKEIQLEVSHLFLFQAMEKYICGDKPQETIDASWLSEFFFFTCYLHQQCNSNGVGRRGAWLGFVRPGAADGA